MHYPYCCERTNLNITESCLTVHILNSPYTAESDLTLPLWLQINIPLGDVEIYKVAPSEIPSCHCSPMMENPCGPDSDCINRLMMYECNALACPAGEHCQNQRFQKREDADARPYKTELRGWGLRSRADIKKVHLLI